MRRSSIVLLIVAMALVVVLPATAIGKPDKPSPELTSYDVSLTLVDNADGLGACEGQPLVMTDISGALLADGIGDTSIPRLWLRAAVP